MPPRCTESISVLKPTRLQDDRGLGHHYRNGVIRSHQASAQIVVWIKEGCKTPAGSSAGVGHTPCKFWASSAKAVPLCQGPELQEQYGFRSWGFPTGSLPCQVLTLQGDASNILGDGEKTNWLEKWSWVGRICGAFSLCTPLPSPPFTSIVQVGKGEAGRTGRI